MPSPNDLCNLTDVRNYINMVPGPVVKTAVIAGGNLYTTITIVAVSVDGNGSGATFTGVLSGGALIGITLNTPGQGYTQAPNLLISGDGTGAQGVCYLTDDYLLSKLITNSSQFFLNRTNRPNGILPVNVPAERRNGNGSDRMSPYWWPILSVTSLSISGVVVPSSPDGVQAGWINDDNVIYLVAGGLFPTRTPMYAAYAFYQGYQNVSINYTYGWSSVPNDINEAVVELTAQKYKRRSHIDQDSQRLGDQVISFSKKDVPPEVQSVIDQYRIKGIIE